MTWLVSIVVAVLSGVVSLLLTGLIANACVRWYHVSSREGAAGYFVLFLAIGGGIAGFFLGLSTARFMASHYGPGFGREIGAALAVILIIAGAAALLCRLLADVPPKLDGQKLTLEVEFRFPNTYGATQPPTAGEECQCELVSLSGRTYRKRESGTVATKLVRFENGQWIVPITARLFTERGGRSVTLSPQEGKEAFGFLLPVPRRPGRKHLEWSPWYPRRQMNGQPWPANKMSCRFRVQKIAPPPPPKSHEEYEAEESARKEAVFLAIPATSPVQAWFPYLDYDQPETERALKLVASRAHLAAELGRLAIGADAELAGKALRCLEKLPALAPEFVAPVRVAGRDIAERLRTVVATTTEEDPGYEGAAGISIRFNGWMCAVRALRGKLGADFTPELKPILELSRQRPDSHALQSDVCRVASYYLHEWANIAPLPNDPKPR